MSDGDFTKSKGEYEESANKIIEAIRKKREKGHDGGGGADDGWRERLEEKRAEWNMSFGCFFMRMWEAFKNDYSNDPNILSPLMAEPASDRSVSDCFFSDMGVGLKARR